MNAFPKTCACGKVHGPIAWSLLPLTGVMTIEGVTLEMRQCQCGSTLTLCIAGAELLEGYAS